MISSGSVQESPRLPRKPTAGKPTTFIQSNRPRLHSWPGQPQFDDEDEEEFGDWDGDSDLPGLENGPHGSF